MCLGSEFVKSLFNRQPYRVTVVELLSTKRQSVRRIQISVRDEPTDGAMLLTGHVLLSILALAAMVEPLRTWFWLSLEF